MINGKISALLLSVCLLFTACGSEADAEPLPDETTAEKPGIGEAAPLSCTVEGNERPDIVFSDPEVGGSTILCQDTLGGYTARLELLNIRSLPEDKDGVYMADQARVTVDTPYGNQWNLGLINGLDSNDGEGVWADCAENSLKIFQVGREDGIKHYILMIYTVYVESRENYAAMFYDITDVSGHYGGAVYIHCDWRVPTYLLDVSDEFAYKEDATFVDSKLCYELTFGFEEKFTDEYDMIFRASCIAAEGFSYEPVYGSEPEIWGNIIFSEDTLGGYTARLVVQGISRLPSDERNYYIADEKVEFTLTDENGNSASTVLNNIELSRGGHGGAVYEDCTENAVKLYEIEWNGEKRYILRGYIGHGDLYNVRFYSCDLGAAENGVLKLYTVPGGTCGDFYVSDSLVYKGGSVLYDEKQQMELIIDPDNFTVTTVQLTEE